MCTASVLMCPRKRTVADLLTTPSTSSDAVGSSRLLILELAESSLRALLKRCSWLPRIFTSPVLCVHAVDHLVTNAGITHSSFFDEVRDLNTFQQVVVSLQFSSQLAQACTTRFRRWRTSTNFAALQDVTFWGYVYSTYYALPHLKRTKGKILVNASVAAWFPHPREAIYNVSTNGCSRARSRCPWMDACSLNSPCTASSFLHIYLVLNLLALWPFVLYWSPGCKSRYYPTLRDVAGGSRQPGLHHYPPARCNRERDD